MNKLTTTLLAGAIVTILFWALKQFAGIEAPNEVSNAGVTVVCALLAHFLDKNGDGNVDA